MPPILLFRDTFAEDANLVDHTPTPSGGPAWEYDDIPGAYTTHVYGALDGPPAASTAPARNLYSIPTSVTKWRIQIDLSRGGVDAVGGGFIVYALVAPGAIASWDPINCLSIGIIRRSLTEVSFTATYIRPATPPGPSGVTLRSGSILMPGSTAKRFILEVDQTAGTVELYVADAITGLNELTIGVASLDPVVGDGLFTQELTDHVANDTTERLIGLQGGWASSGLVYFAASELRVYELEVLPTGDPCTQLLQVFADNRTTLLWEVSTDPNHAFPFLEEPSDYAEQELDFAGGAASIGTMRARIIDKAQIPGDQDSGFLTGKLATFGVPDIGGHRCRWIRFDPNGVPVVVIDGPAGQPAMIGYSGFEFEINDTRETEADIRCFDVVGPSAPVVDDAAATGPTTPGTDPGFTWGTEYH